MDKKKMTRADLEAYRARWQRVNEFELEEIRQMPLAEKLKKAEMLFGFARALNVRHSIDDPEIVAVRERWAKLKRRNENTKRT